MASGQNTGSGAGTVIEAAPEHQEVRPGLGQFGLPRGPLGHAAGWIMARALRRDDADEMLALLDVRPGDRLLEVGCGPGVLLREVLAGGSPALVAGVDPSGAMLAQAARANREEVADGRARLVSGTAAALPFPDNAFDRVVSVNNVALWPDLPAGMRELSRVLRPGGLAVLAWHSRTAVKLTARRLGLDERELLRLRDAFAAEFTEVRRFELSNVVAFTGRG